MIEQFVGQAAGLQALAGFAPVHADQAMKTLGLRRIVDKGVFPQHHLPRFAVKQGDAIEGELFGADVKVGQTNVAVHDPRRLVPGGEDANLVRCAFAVGPVAAVGLGAARDVAGEGVMTRAVIVL